MTSHPAGPLTGGAAPEGGWEKLQPNIETTAARPIEKML
jgi:hypothetical protein